MSSVSRERMPYQSKPVPMVDLVLDTDAQPRTAIDAATVTEYREALDSGAIFDNIAAFFDGKKYWLADGFHRAMAYQASDRSHIPGNVYEGGKREAILFATGANATHGLKRSNADKERAVTILLSDPEWTLWSNEEIARRASVSPHTVARIRKEIARSTLQTQSDSTRKTSDGRTMDTSNIGKKSSAPVATVPTHSPLAEIDDSSESEPPAASLPKAAEVAETPAAASEEDGRVDSEKGDAYEPPTDAEWLATLPLSSKLTGQSLKRFHADALLYRTMEPHRRLFGHHAAVAMNTSKRSGGRDGAYIYRLDTFLRIQHPSLWKCCPTTENHGCGGLGHLPAVGKCPHNLCRGRGYWII